MSSAFRFHGVLGALCALALACNSQPTVSPGGVGGSSGATGGSSGATGGSTGATGGSGAAGNQGGGRDAFVLPDTPVGAGGAGGGLDGAAADERQCGLQNFNLEKVPPDLLLVLDRSSSMNQAVMGAAAGATLWSETLGAVDDVVKNTQAGVNWGLKLFPLPTGCMVSDTAEVAVAPMNYMPVLDRARMQGTNSIGGGLMGGTPTDTAVIGATTYLKTLAATKTNPKYILLATDGEPTCANGSSFGDAEGAAIAAIQAAVTAGFKTYVIGLAIGPAGTATLNEMATAGGVPRNDPTVKFYPVANKADLVATLTTITGQVTNCVFPLDRAPPVPDNVKVTIDGQRVEQSMTNGWSYTSGAMTAIQFNGPACEMIKTRQAQVNIVFGCPGIVIP